LKASSPPVRGDPNRVTFLTVVENLRTDQGSEERPGPIRFNSVVYASAFSGRSTAIKRPLMADPTAMSQGPVQNQGEKSVASSSVSQFGRLKPMREIRPSEIHELRLRTSHIQAEVKLQQTQFNRLKAEILSHREAITRAVKKKTVEHAPGATLHKSMIQQLERSLRSAREVLRKLEDEINDAEVEDKMAFARETEEELKEIYTVRDSKRAGAEGETRSGAGDGAIEGS
jgi:flagellar biosynthesis chaperone FliJ